MKVVGFGGSDERWRWSRNTVSVHVLSLLIREFLESDDPLRLPNSGRLCFSPLLFYYIGPTVDLKQHGFISWSIVKHSVYELVRIPSRMYKYYNVKHSLQLYYNTPLDDCYKDRAERGVCIIHRLNTRTTCQHTSLCHITWSWLHWERT